MEFVAGHKGEGVNITAFNEIFGEYHQRFIRFAEGYTLDHASAEDIVMESFSLAWRHREKLTRSKFPAYTLTIVKNRCLNYLRDQKIHLRAAEELYAHGLRMINNKINTLEACEPDDLFVEDTLKLVQHVLDKLPAHTHEVFERSRVRGQSYREIAEDMGITVKNVEFEISKVLKLIRQELRLWSILGTIVCLILLRSLFY